VVTYFDILDSASKDLIKGKITSKQYISAIYFVIKAADKVFEKKICKRALNTFKKINDEERIKLFQYVLNNIYNVLNNFAKLYKGLISDNGNLNIIINFINPH